MDREALRVKVLYARRGAGALLEELLVFRGFRAGVWRWRAVDVLRDRDGLGCGLEDDWSGGAFDALMCIAGWHDGRMDPALCLGCV